MPRSPANALQRTLAWLSSVPGITALLTGLLLLSAPIQHGLLKHDAYRSLGLICFTALFAGFYLKRSRPLGISKRYVVSAALLSLWGLATAFWSSSGGQALVFALLPPLLFLAIPILARSWQQHPWACAYALAAAAVCIFGLEILHVLGSWLTGDTTYRMPVGNPIRPYFFYNSRDANQFHVLLIWSSLPCLIRSLEEPRQDLRHILFGAGLLIPAVGIFLILASQGDGALIAIGVGSLSSWLMLRNQQGQALAWFALALGIGSLMFVVLNLTIGNASLFGDFAARNADEFDPTRGRLRSWLAHGRSIITNQLWLGAGYRAIPAGSGLCGPHNVLVSLTYALGLPGLVLAGLWVSSLRWRIAQASLPIQALAPGSFTALLLYQLVDEIWGFTPSLVLICILMGMVCPLAAETAVVNTSSLSAPRETALIGLVLIALFFVAARTEPFVQGQPARQSCMMGFISPQLKKQIPKGMIHYQLVPDDSTSFRPVQGSRQQD